jgi:hypothetical protein
MGIGRGRLLPGTSLAWLREPREGESIAQRSQRTQRGIGLVGRNFCQEALSA